jgi:hypothetical protein
MPRSIWISACAGPSQVDLFVQNLTDGRAIVWIGRGLRTDTLQRARPRSITLSLRHAFRALCKKLKNSHGR